jgi:hypothetical protein
MRTSNIPEANWPLASAVRTLFALYIDYLLFCAPWRITIWALTTFIDLEREPFGLRIIFFGILESSLFKHVKWSPGLWLLGIQYQTKIDYSVPIEKGGTRNVRIVDPWLRSNERWWTMLFGVLAILNGAKSMVRWTTWKNPFPFFGVQLDDVSSALLMFVLGAFECIVGMAALRLRPAVLPLGALYYIAYASSVLLSWHLWPDFIEKVLRTLRQHQGLPVRLGGIESLQAALPMLFLVVPVTALIYLAPVYLRVRKAHVP